MNTQINYSEINNYLKSRSFDVVSNLLPGGKMIGREWEVGSLHGEKGKSLKVNLNKGIWCDFASDDKGDLFELWHKVKGFSQKHETAKDICQCYCIDIPTNNGFINSNDSYDDYKPSRDGNCTGKWTYHNENGSAFASIYRYDKKDEPRKDFIPFQPDNTVGLPKDPDGNVKQRPIYNAHFLKDTGDIVVIVEGEKCADALTSKGFMATTSMNGAKSADKTNWHTLQNKDVIILPDNDEAGLNYATVVNDQLKDIAKSVKVVPLEALQEKPKKWDIADGIDAGMLDVHIQALLDQAINADTKLAIENLGFDIKGLSIDMLRGQPLPTRYLVDDLFPTGKVCLFAGSGGVGKSFILYDLCLQVITGGQFLEKGVSQGNAVFVTGEDDKNDLHTRISILDKKGARFNTKNKVYTISIPEIQQTMILFEESFEGVRATEKFEYLKNQLSNIPNLKLIVLDPLQVLMNIDTNRPSSIQFVMTHLSILAKELDTTIIIAHHMSKQQKPVINPEDAKHIIRGSSALVDGVRVAMAMWEVTPQEKRDFCAKASIDFSHQIIRAAVVKANGKADRSFKTLARMKDGSLKDISDLVDNQEIIQPNKKDEKLLNTSIQHFYRQGDPFSRSDIHDRREELPEPLNTFSRSRLWNMVDSLVKNKVVLNQLWNGKKKFLIPNTNQKEKTK
ncbi:MAG: AAA family ATPase [Proteobacteria bacterium]|nr:AAA family ATPase [Pseudomonadota bacterium]